nr:DUF5941 domain-containing protein [Spirilliplanes yamanashiensis]
MSAAGAHDIHLIAERDPAADLAAIATLARAATGPLLLVAGDLVAHGGLLRLLATEPAGRTAALVAAPGGPHADGDAREERGRIVAGPSNVRFLGALCVAPRDLPALAAAAERLGSAGGAAVGVRVASAVDLLLPELLRAGVAPQAVRVRLLHAERVGDAAGFAAARARAAAIDEDAALLRLAVKERDDFFTTYAVSTWSPVVTKWAARLRLTPTGVTAVSVLFAVAAALAFWQASRPAMVAGAVLLYLGFVLDCVDGQLARYTRRFSPFGGWLDTMADRAKEYAAYAGLAAGADRLGLEHAWPLAIAAMILQTVRHMTDAWYGALHDEAARRQAGGQAAGGVSGRLSRASERVQADTGSPAYWLKRIVVFPIGERWALIAVLAAVADGRVALLGVLGWGLLAAAYTLGLRTLRARGMRVGVLATTDVARHRDDGPVARLLGGSGLPGPLAFALLGVAAGAVLLGLAAAGRLGDDPRLAVAFAALGVLAAGLPSRAAHDGALDWLVPAALRAGQYLFVAGVGVACAVPAPLVFALVFTLALHHYDVTALMEKGAPDRVVRLRPGWDVVVVLLTLAAAAGWATGGTIVLACLGGGAFVIGALAGRRSAQAEGVPA